MTQPVQILGSYWTLAVGADPLGEQRCFHDFRVRVETAAKAGFTAMGFWHTDLSEIRKKYSFREMKRILDDNGITQIEVEWLLDWFCTDERRAASDADPQAVARCRRSTRRASHQDRRSRQRLRGRSAADGGIWPAVSPGRGARHERAVRNASGGVLACTLARSGAGDLPRVPVPRTAASCWTTCICSEPATPPRGHRAQDRRDIPLGVEINDGTLAMPVKSPGLRRQQTPAAGRRGVRHRRISARGLDAGL